MRAVLSSDVSKVQQYLKKMKGVAAEFIGLVNRVNLHGNTALIHAASIEPSTDNSNAIAKLLIETPGVNVNVVGGHGETALMAAAKHHNAWLVSKLARVPGINANCFDIYGRTALSIVASYMSLGDDRWSYEQAETACKAILAIPDIDVNLKLGFNRSDLILLDTRDLRIFKLILSHPGMDVNARNGTGNTVYSGLDVHDPRLDLILDHPGVVINRSRYYSSEPLILKLTRQVIKYVEEARKDAHLTEPLFTLEKVTRASGGADMIDAIFLVADCSLKFEQKMQILNGAFPQRARQIHGTKYFSLLKKFL